MWDEVLYLGNANLLSDIALILLVDHKAFPTSGIYLLLPFVFKGLQESSKVFKGLLGSLRNSKNLAGSLRVFKNLQESLKVFKGLEGSLRILKNL